MLPSIKIKLKDGIYTVYQDGIYTVYQDGKAWAEAFTSLELATLFVESQGFKSFEFEAVS
jgi:hypothetical protein